MTFRQFLAVLGMLAAVSHHAAAEAPFSFASTPGKLPKDIIPERYVVHVAPDPATFTFQGYERIDIRVLRRTSKIVLNASGIEIDSASLTGDDRRSELLAPRLDAEQELLTFTSAHPLTPGRYTLTLAYRGTINRQAQGLFYDKYSAPSGDKVLLATQMEPTYARRLLPCWDEPVFRARFRISVDLPPTYRPYSNMPIATQRTMASGLRRTTFGDTPSMASYLLVLVAGELDRSVSVRDGIELGIVATEGMRETTGYAMRASQQLLHYYNDYFGVAYSLPKLDQIAIPGGFRGAMENWGAIVYNDSTLLYDASKSSDETQRRVYAVVAHEMAHQWFGDLVTMAWWDNLWLNEGFASWMGTKSTDHFNPQWRVWLEAGARRDYAMNLDARKTTHPVQQEVASEQQAGDAFDRITYQKGQTLLRMLETYLGEVRFRGGIRAYIERHKYSNTTTADLWTALEQASGKPVRSIASGWTTQPGFPVVSVEARCTNGRREISLRQEQFKLDEARSSDILRWSIPIQIGIDPPRATNREDFYLLSERNATISRPGCSGALVIDPLSVGYYRVAYTQELFSDLLKRFAQLPDTARLKLVSDTWALVEADRIPLSEYADLLSRLGNEPRLAVWESVIRALDTLDNLTLGDPSRAVLRHFAVALIAPRFRELGWEEKPGESMEDRRLRASLLRALATYEDAGVVAEGRARFAQFLAHPESLRPSLAEVVPYIAGRYADQGSYDALMRLARTSLTSEEKIRYFGALTAALDPQLAAQTLQLALSFDAPPIITSRIAAEVAASDHLDLAWSFAKKNGDALFKMQRAMAKSEFFPSIVETATDVSVADDLENYVKTNLPAENLVVAQRTGELIRIHAKLKARLVPQLPTVFKSAG